MARRRAETLSVAVMHHPARAHRLEPLIATLGRPCEVVSDPDPDAGVNPWRTAREAWAAADAACAWRLVIQDDVLPCRDFLAGVEAALAVAPGPVCSFYLGNVPQTTAIRMRVHAGWYASWVPGQYGDWVPTLALAIRTPLALDLADYESGLTVIGDDTIVGRWVGDRRIGWWATIPSLVQHDDDEPSIIGGHGAHPGQRQAACFIGQHSALEVDWSRL